MSIFKAMKQKKKRAVNPDIPRPNLFTHEKKLKDMQSANDSAAQTITQLQSRIQRLERKLASQTTYLQALHNKIRG
jgi:CII-binding regulator of phage lambda lysogenization HflD